MQSIKREYHNTKYVAENCNDLHCLQNDDTPRGREITSTWELDARDRELIASGGNICLTFVGERQPPCRVECEVDFLDRYNNEKHAFAKERMDELKKNFDAMSAYVAENTDAVKAFFAEFEAFRKKGGVL